jgi:predicted Zn-dependent peptidase
MTMIPIQRTLSNGLRLLLTPLAQTQAVTVLLLTKVGSRYEAAPISGVSHFLEHMMFKGTEKRPTAQDVSRELDRVGADYNAFTAKDSTGYYVKLSSDHFELALDIVSDMLWRSRFLEEEVARERNVIIEEINMYYDNPMMLLEDVFEELVFGKDHPLGRHIAGAKDTVRSITRSAVVGYFRRHYFPRNMVLSIAGHFPARTAPPLVGKYFGHRMPAKRRDAFPAFRAVQRSPRLSIMFRETEQVQLGLGFPALPYDHADQPALSVLTVILGGNMSSRLFSRVREREGLCYHISASRSPYEDTGTLFIRSGLDKGRLQPALTLILRILREIRDDGVTKEEVENAKEFLRGKLTLSLEDSETIADFFAKQKLLMKRMRSPAQRLAAIQRVSRADVLRVARNILMPARTNCSLIGPFRDSRPFASELRSW